MLEVVYHLSKEYKSSDLTSLPASVLESLVSMLLVGDCNLCLRTGYSTNALEYNLTIPQATVNQQCSANSAAV